MHLAIKVVAAGIEYLDYQTNQRWCLFDVAFATAFITVFIHPIMPVIWQYKVVQ